jgi:hypothetical protein
MPNTSVSNAFAGDRPARKRRECWKNAAAIALGTEVFSSSASVFVRRLCFGFEPIASGTHCPGAIAPEGRSGSATVGPECGAQQL